MGRLLESLLLFLRVIFFALAVPFLASAGNEGQISVSSSSVKLIVWQAAPSANRIILPQKNSETPQEAVQRYIRSVLQEPDFRQLNPSAHLASLPIGTIRSLNQFSKKSQVRVAFIANWFQDLAMNSGRMGRNVKNFNSAGADSFVIALAADYGLTKSEQKSFRDQLVKSAGIDLLVALGGDDIHPRIYNERIKEGSDIKVNEISVVRDAFEIDLIKRYKKEQKGVFFGICRGHQMGALADGHTIFQDLVLEKQARRNEHRLYRDGVSIPTWHHVTVFSSLLERFTQRLGFPSIINSVHHQAVKVQNNAGSYPVAQHGLVTEALQMKPSIDGYSRGLSVQFHPEFPAEISGSKEFSTKSFQIIEGIISYSRMIRQKSRQIGFSCRSLYAN